MGKASSPVGEDRPPLWLAEYEKRTAIFDLMRDAFNPQIPDAVIRLSLKEIAYSMQPPRAEKRKQGRKAKVVNEDTNSPTAGT